MALVEIDCALPSISAILMKCEQSLVSDETASLLFVAVASTHHIQGLCTYVAQLGEKERETEMDDSARVFPALVSVRYGVHFRLSILVTSRQPQPDSGCSG
ncbi:hypothetical protein J3458_007054 [Metarhizium acridum]|uniref:uncharacterized protein n=1 Tax=Metarhizium acridum TaxID=92637 RepID=UPI001C6C0C40|nr:hypothetical protein J3458_007054 [Metarhizium acridum]